MKQVVLSTLLATLILTACGGDKPETMLASAKDYLAKNDSKAAIIQIKNALQADPNLPEARILLGKALLESGDASSAEVELRKALDLKASRDDVIPTLARALLYSGQGKKVTEDFGKEELGAPAAKAELQTILAEAWAGLGKAEQSSAALAAALAAQPDYAPAMIVQSRVKASSGDYPAALEILNKILGKDASNQDALKLKGDILAVQGKTDEALAAYRKSVEVKPSFVAGHVSIVALLLRLDRPEEAEKQLEPLKKLAPKFTQTVYLEAQLAYQKKDLKKARELTQQVLKGSSNNPAVLQLAGAIEYQDKSWLQAESYLSKVLQATPDLMSARRLLISTYLRSGQPAKALAALQPALEKIGDDPGLLTLAGEVFMQNGEPQKAEGYFAKAAKLDPKDARKRTALAVTHLASGSATGYDELQDIAASDSGVTADMALISAYLQRKEIDKAMKAIDALEKKQPKEPLAHNLRGRVLMGKQDMAGARASFEKALALNPAFFPAAANLAALDLADKKPDDARKRFESVLAADAKSTQALIALAELKARTGGSPEEVIAQVNKAVSASPLDPTPRLLLIDLTARTKDFKKTVAVAQDAVTAIPDNAQLLDALGKAQQASGDTNQAIATYNKLSSLQPASPLPHLRIAEIQSAQKNNDAAGESLRKALELKPDLIEAQRGLIGLAVAAGKTADAVTIARNVQKQRPQDAVGFLLEGDAHIPAKAWDKAAEAYRGGLKLAGASELATRLHGVLIASGKAGDADKFAAQWLKDKPKDAYFRLYLGDRATAKQDYDAATTMYKAVLDLQPDNALVLNNLAWASAQQKNPKAIEYAEKAVKLSPNQPPFMDTLAMLLAAKGEYPRALELLRNALKLQPQATQIRLNLAKVLLQSGDKSAAKTELQELAKLGDKFPAQAEVTQLLKGL